MLSSSLIPSLLSLSAGIFILLVPRLLNYIIAFYLLIVGASGLAKIFPFPWLASIMALGAGMVIFLFPKILNQIVAFLLIMMGVWGIAKYY